MAATAMEMLADFAWLPVAAFLLWFWRWAR